jgi:hypothetical protein
VKAFAVFGWTWDGKRRGRGTHFILTKPGMRPTLSIPNHHEVKRTLIAAQIALACITEADYVSAFHGTYKPPDEPPAASPEVIPAPTTKVTKPQQRKPRR